MLSSLEKTQPELYELFSKLLKEKSFPLVSLFSGPAYSGRMFAATSIAEELGSDESSTIIISDREHKRIIAAAIELYRNNKTRRAAIFLKNTVSVMLREFNGAMLDSATGTAKKKFTEAGNCSELIAKLPDLDEKEVNSFCSSLEKSVSAILGNKNSTGSITVSQVRNIKSWCSTSSLEKRRKTVIIEGLENALSSASNALLKILEEPPQDTAFILISRSISSIPPTILSRVRIFNFKIPDGRAINYILNSISAPAGEFKDLEAFIWKFSGCDEALIEKCAFNLTHAKDFPVPDLIRELEKSQSWDRFFHLVLLNIGSLADPDSTSYERISYLYREIDRAVSQGDTFNQNMRLLLDFVIFRTREFIR
ncbi:MAG: hypothetical protein K5634_05570 [Sphaerochaetaceae bacterium]|nr:hypothetical protein [Sphaerochaetaceae bacterium]